MVTLKQNTKNCTNCMECVKNCTGNALQYHKGAVIFHENNCTLCEVCMDVCDNNAIEVKE